MEIYDIVKINGEELIYYGNETYLLLNSFQYKNDSLKFEAVFIKDDKFETLKYRSAYEHEFRTNYHYINDFNCIKYKEIKNHIKQKYPEEFI